MSGIVGDTEVSHHGERLRGERDEVPIVIDAADFLRARFSYQLFRDEQETGDAPRED